MTTASIESEGEGVDEDGEFQIESSLTDTGALTIRVFGELDMATSDRLFGAVTALDPPATECIVDLAACTFIDSSGIRALLLSQRELDGAATLRLIGVTPHVHRVLTIAGVHHVLHVTNLEAPPAHDAE